MTIDNLFHDIKDFGKLIELILDAAKPIEKIVKDVLLAKYSSIPGDIAGIWKQLFDGTKSAAEVLKDFETPGLEGVADKISLFLNSKIKIIDEIQNHAQDASRDVSEIKFSDAYTDVKEICQDIISLTKSDVSGDERGKRLDAINQKISDIKK